MDGWSRHLAPLTIGNWPLAIWPGPVTPFLVNNAGYAITFLPNRALLHPDTYKLA
jgi:hypothetical protein